MYLRIHIYTFICTRLSPGTAYPTQGDMFECCFKAQSSKLERLFCHVSVKRGVRALSFELWKSFSKMSPQMEYAVHWAMGWLRLVGSLTLQVSFAKETYKRDDILQKRPLILINLLIVATPYTFIYTSVCTPLFIYTYIQDWVRALISRIDICIYTHLNHTYK